MTTFSLAFGLALGLASSAAMAAGMNNPPPAGPVILDLAGQAVPHTYTQYTTSFRAGSAATDFSFAFREDPAFLFLDDVSVVARGTTTNLVVNGGFEDGPVNSNAPAGWTYVNVYNSAAAGRVENFGAHSGTNSYYDGSVQAYDAITQSLATVVGTTYDVTFWLNDNSGLTTFNHVSTNGNTTNTGGNGIDLLVYAGNGIPTPGTVPLPPALPMFGAAIAALGAFGYGVKRRKGQAAA